MQVGLQMENLIEDVRVSLRGLLRAPMMTVTIAATVGLGLGATTVVFSAVNAALLEPLSYRNPARLVRIYTDAPPNKFRFSVADYLALQAQQTEFEQIAGYTDRAMAFSDRSVAERLRGRVVSWTYFSLLGLQPAIGRDFTEQDGRPGSPRRSSSATHSGGSGLADARTPSAGPSGSTARTTPLLAFFPRRWVRWSSDRISSWRRSGMSRRAEDRSSSRCSGGCAKDRDAWRPQVNCVRSTGASSRCGGRHTRTRRPRGA
jgi:hypothetical protein